MTTLLEQFDEIQRHYDRETNVEFKRSQEQFVLNVKAIIQHILNTKKAYEAH